MLEVLLEEHIYIQRNQKSLLLNKLVQVKDKKASGKEKKKLFLDDAEIKQLIQFMAWCWK